MAISYQRSKPIKSLFFKSRYYGLRALAYLILCIAIMLADHHAVLMVPHRLLSYVSNPLQALATRPGTLWQLLSTNLQTHQQLLRENQDLKREQFVLQVKLQRLEALEYENNSLKHLLNASRNFTGRTLVANIVFIRSNPFTNEVVLDQGIQAGVYVGQPVLDGKGIVGQIISVDNHSARALMIADPRSAVPVQDARTGVRALASGLGLMDQLKLEHVPTTADIKIGDHMISSGLGQRFPYGYPVGQVIAINQNAGGLFSAITIAPSAKLNSVRQVILLWPHPAGHRTKAHSRRAT